ncbi:6-carboxytetrahydropterin synthase [Candidatus Sumerlaeota bacterium]|nr:6-carboxytetrahydropterin synthase [Candidatus Sumerlaeota bacterium]
MNKEYGIRIAKDRFKFSCSHMTIFPDGTAERLHGHNYHVRVELTGSEAPQGMLYDPRPLKRVLGEICAELDEKCLMPRGNPALSVNEDGENNYRVTLFGKTYSLPKDDTALLPLPNITMEALAGHVAERLTDALKLRDCRPTISRIRVEVEESQGQLVWIEYSIES